MKLINRIAIIGVTLFCLLPTHSSASAKSQTRHVPVWQKVALIPFTIVPRAVEGAPVRADQSAVMQRLSVEAGTRAERLLLQRRIATSVIHVASAQTATAPVFVSGTVSLPVSLPHGVIGWNARSSKGVFATAKVLLTDAAGKILVQEEVALNWDDVRWLRGGRTKRNLPLDDVLRKFTRKAVDRAIEQLARHVLVSSSR